MEIRTLYDLCEVISRELEDVSRKIDGGSMTAGDLELVDKLTHALKSIKTTMAMMESEDGYSFENRRSNRGGRSYEGRSYEGGNSMRRNSRRNYARSRNGYSYAEDDLDSVIEEMRGMMSDLPEEKRKEVERFINKME